MSNVSCGVCGNEKLVSVDILGVIVIGYCDCIEVPEVEVYTPEEPVCEEGGVEIEDQEYIDVYEESEFLVASGCQSCGEDDPLFNGELRNLSIVPESQDFHVCMVFGCSNTPEYEGGMCDECWKSLHEKAPEACITCGVKISTGVLCNPCRVKEFTIDEIEGSVSGEDFIYAYTGKDIIDVCKSEEPNENGFYLEQDKLEPVAVNVAPKWVEAAMVLMMIVSFFQIIYDIGTGKNNNPKLVLAWYAFCAYLVVSYSAVILWFLL